MEDPIARLEDLVGELETRLGALSPQALDRRPDDGGWTAREVMAHLQTTVAQYLRRLARLQAARPPRRTRARRTLFGRMLIGVLTRPGKRYKAPRVFRPPPEVRGDLTALLDVHRRLGEAARDLERQGLLERALASPVNPLLRLSAREAVEAMVLHGRRHLAQALRAAAG